MDKNSLRDLLQLNKVPNDLYSLNGGLPSEAYCMNKDGNIWGVYYSERGVKSNIVKFDNESEACRYLLMEVEKIVSIKK